MSTTKITTTIYNPAGTINRILNDDVGKFVANEWSRYFAKYVPMREGILAQNITIEPFKVTYNSPYAHYQWEGEKYVDPIYNVGGFHNADFSVWWSRPGVTKIPSGELLNYSKEQNPLATSHWEQPAYNAFKDAVAKAVTDYLKRK